MSTLSRLRRCALCVGLAASVAVVVPAGWGFVQAKESDDKEKEGEEEEVDHVALAARLFKDGHYDRAELVLRQVDVKKEGIDLPRFYTLQGLVHLKREAHKDALRSFEKAVAAGQTEKVIYLYLAQTHFALKDYKKTIGALDKAGSAGSDVPGTFFMRSQAHWELKQHDAALRALDAGQKAFPEQHEFSRIKLFYLIDLGLFQEVSRVGEMYLDRPDASADDYAAVGEGLRRSKQLKQARDVLEAAHLRYPDDEKLAVLLAHTYLDQGHALIAAMLFEDLARTRPKYALEAAELYLKAGRHERALYNNARVLEPGAKMKQRLAILLKLEQFNMVTGMAPNLSRLDLLQDQNIRYALAYAYFKVGEFNQAEGHLKHVTDPKLFESALQLRKAMATCRQQGWECT